MPSIRIAITFSKSSLYMLTMGCTFDNSIGAFLGKYLPNQILLYFCKANIKIKLVLNISLNILWHCSSMFNIFR